MAETRLRVAALIVREGRVLLVSTRRGQAGYVVPPGGGVEAGEGLAEAVEREVAEEAGLAVQAGALVAWREFVQGPRRVVELYFSAELLSALEGESPEDRDLLWVEVGRLGEVQHYPEQLAELCGLAAGGYAGAVALGSFEINP